MWISRVIPIRVRYCKERRASCVELANAHSWHIAYHSWPKADNLTFSYPRSLNRANGLAAPIFFLARVGAAGDFNERREAIQYQ